MLYHVDRQRHAPGRILIQAIRDRPGRWLSAGQVAYFAHAAVLTGVDLDLVAGVRVALKPRRALAQ
ncbi:hypothetical protein D3C76_1609540 [compost metagenome]